MNTFNIWYYTELEKIRVRAKLYGIPEETVKVYDKACIHKAQTTRYSYFDLMEMLINDWIRHGEPNLSSWILQD